MLSTKNPFHTHVDEVGRVVKCYHETKSILTSGSFWLGITFSFPLEHFLYEKVWPFTLITQFLGL